MVVITLFASVYIYMSIQCSHSTVLIPCYKNTFFWRQSRAIENFIVAFGSGIVTNINVNMIVKWISGKIVNCLFSFAWKSDATWENRHTCYVRRIPSTNPQTGGAYIQLFYLIFIYLPYKVMNLSDWNY